MGGYEFANILSHHHASASSVIEVELNVAPRPCYLALSAYSMDQMCSVVK